MDQTVNAVNRRSFLTGMAAAGAAFTAGSLLKAQGGPSTSKIDHKIRAGIIGCGGRGAWIANLFNQHGGYEFIAVADYFKDRSEKVGAALGVEKSKCFSGLSSYKRLIDSGVEAVILETPPYFFPEHAQAAVEAGLHVYMAKPVAVDVPGVIKIGDLSRAATRQKRVFLVDYQIPTDPINIEVYNRVRQGALGALQMVFSVGQSGGGHSNDPPLTDTIENRLIDLIWIHDDAIGCGYIGNFDIHSIDALIWVLGRRPVCAYAKGGRFRKDPHGDTLDTYFITYTFDDGLVWNHHSAAGPTHDWLKQGQLEASIQGDLANAHLSYFGKAYLRGGPKHFAGGPVADLYESGAKRNITAFHDAVLEGNYGNETIPRSVDSTLTCILGREAARRSGFLTMDELLRENKRLELNLKGLNP
jgi:myo-inositol 2-dehydrogenase / D-chiro-inositol 1-dehydrogenase